MCGEFLHVDQLESCRSQCGTGRQHSPVLEVFVINGVELSITNEIQGVVNLDTDSTVIGNQEA